jgi:GDP-mannose 6-dehydrogenase
MLGGILPSNLNHIDHAMAKVLQSGRRKIGMIGLSFKGGTDDLRESPLVLLAEHFIGKGLSVLVYDPEVHLSNLLGANRRFIERHLPHIGSLIRSDISAVIAQSELLVVGLNDASVAAALAEHVRPDQIVLDLARLPDGRRLRGDYWGLCW